MIVGAYLALRQTDLKLILAYLTVSALGILILFIGVGTSEAIIAAIVFLLGMRSTKARCFWSSASSIMKPARETWRSWAVCDPRCPSPQP